MTRAEQLADFIVSASPEDIVNAIANIDQIRISELTELFGMCADISWQSESRLDKEFPCRHRAGLHDSTYT